MPITFVPGPGTTGFDPIPTLIPFGAPGDVDLGPIVGPLIDLIGGVIGGKSPTSPQLPQLPGGVMPQLPRLPQNGDFTLGGAIPANGCPTQACCKGKHLNKSTDCAGNPPGSKCVSNRRMNPLNSRALKRATRRLKGFERAVKGTRKQLRTLAKI